MSPIYTLEVEGYFDVVGEMIPEDTPPSSSMPQLWRVKHDIELGTLWRPNLPEVHPFFPNHYTPFFKGFQLLTIDMNKNIEPRRLSNVFLGDKAFTNGQGVDMKGDPRANWFKREYLDKEPPKLENLTCGGAYLAGRVKGTRTGDVLVVDALDGFGPAPTLEWIMRPENVWARFHAVSVDSLGVPRLFPQGGGTPVILPFIAHVTRFTERTIPLSKLQEWDMSKPLISPYAIP